MCSVYTYNMRVNIYIRKEDEEAWNSIVDKPQWIHEGLATGLAVISPKYIDIDFDALREAGNAMAKTLVQPKNRFGIDEDGSVRQFTCKHGYDPKFCKHAKPGKPCK